MTDQAPMRWQAAEIPLLLWRLPAREKVFYILRERENLPVSLSLSIACRSHWHPVHRPTSRPSLCCFRESMLLFSIYGSLIYVR
jgi:hypothetical protein